MTRGDSLTPIFRSVLWTGLLAVLSPSVTPAHLKRARERLAAARS